jgi:hypothetical protein
MQMLSITHEDPPTCCFVISGFVCNWKTQLINSVLISDSLLRMIRAVLQTVLVSVGNQLLNAMETNLANMHTCGINQ